MKFKVPALFFSDKHKSENTLNHNIVQEQEIDVVSIENTNGYVEVKSTESHYCLSSNEFKIDIKCDHIMLTKTTPVKASVENGRVDLKRWLKHPKLKNYSPEMVQGTWKGAFNFIEEDLENKIP